MKNKLPAQALLAILPMLCLANTAHAYIDLAPSLTKIISQSSRITQVEVAAYDKDRHIVTLHPLTAIKGSLPTADIQHQVSASATAATPRPILQWAAPGARGLLFSSANTALVCFGDGWYQVDLVSAQWKLGKERPDLPLAYYGSVSRLTDAVSAILAGKGAVITAVAYGADNEGASFDLALNRQSLPGIIRLQRLHANSSMPQNVAGASSNPAYYIGVGAVDESDIPALIQNLKSPDPLVRAESADDLRSLARQAKSAAPNLTALLSDPAPRVRFSAASALLRITPRDPQSTAQALQILTTGLNSTDPATSRLAIAAAGFAGDPGAAFTEKLASLLNDKDESIRIQALQSISMLGPAAQTAVNALIPLLDIPDMAVDAADALGRIGAPARPALPRLTQMLASDQYDVRWAAVRSMSQIGGPDARPAVEFMIKAMPNATEVEGYNMMIYLSLLGPDAAEALPALQSFRIKNPVLPSTTAWAISGEKTLPWQFNGGGGGGGFGGPGGRGGRGGGGPGGMGGGGGGPAGLSTLMYQAYIHELGSRLRPLAPILAQKIMDATAGEVPAWGYKILDAGPDLSLNILTPHLADAAQQTRERALVAIGYMGESAAAARDQIQSAMPHAASENEKRLFEWTLRQIDGE